MELLAELAQGGWNALLEYLSAHVITCLVPAFFIAGAISVFISQNAVLKYFGPNANRFLSYGVASVSGTILAVCSCTVLPLFGGIYKRGAGIGPAVAFLYSGPAINVLAITYSARLLGLDLGIARAIGAILFSVAIGLIMAFIYRNEDRNKKNDAAFANLCDDPDAKKWWQQIVLFVVLVGVLLFAASSNWIMLGVSLAALVIIVWKWFTRDEFGIWMKETWRFVRLITPWLLVGVFAAGIITVLLPEAAVGRFVGGNSIGANFFASIFGSLMYFATLTEVPIIKALMDLGMGKGPSLALLLAGPALSLPNMLVIRSIMGTKKTLTYVGLVVLFATISGLIFGAVA
ncbi:MAG: permease [Dehalococcoidales bacterium]|jgi:uncharacterized membrane protein YraQ (UPF0718 family)|nr:permease [Dehalococcoidales bacterium]MDD3264365.1 permease [Dehalococcoidales bacterium]MDD4322131.1 permease [Dehalococcoidales bacterium]MDD4793701.1 permease [Dehalococcoidales bacterium]MDD5122011.1 permease [Dehalococcoidales bacterium]